MRTSARPWIIGLGILPLALALSGCVGGPSLPGAPGGNPDELVEDIVEGSGDGIDFEGGALPDDFPVGDIPLVEGEIGPSTSIGGTAWMVTVYVPTEADGDAAPELLEAAGFTNDSVFYWENEEYIVILVGNTDNGDGRWAVSYQIQVQQ